MAKNMIKPCSRVSFTLLTSPKVRGFDSTRRWFYLQAFNQVLSKSAQLKGTLSAIGLCLCLYMVLHFPVCFPLEWPGLKKDFTVFAGDFW